MSFTLSVVLPIFNEEPLLPELERRLDAALATLDGDAEILFVDDGSSDGSPELLSRFAAEDPRVKVIRLSRNFGHQPAITAGICHARGDALVILDADLEDPPEVIPQLVERWRAGYQVVLAERRSRRDTALRRALFAAFYRVFDLLSDFPMPLNSGVFGLLDRKAYRQLARLTESNRFIPGLRQWIGFRQAIVYYDREERHAGAPKQTFWHLLKYAADAVFSFSYKPLRLSLVFGTVVFALSSLYALVLVVLRLLEVNVVSGFTTVSVAIFFFGGALLVSNGILGEYLGRIYDEVKRRPLFVVERVIGGDAPGGPGEAGSGEP